MNVVTLVAHTPTAVVVAWLIANLFPYISAFLTRAPGWLTGAITLLLSAIDGVVAQWLRDSDHFDWKRVVGTAFVAWVVAVLHHKAVLKGTAPEANLHAKGPQLGEA